MKPSQHISPSKITTALICWLAGTNVLILLHWRPLTVIIFISISLLPGMALLRVMRIAFRTFSARLLYSFGLSLLILMLSGLAANHMLHLFGVARPLELPGVLTLWDVVTGSIIFLNAKRVHTGIQIPAWSARNFPKSAYGLVVASLLLPCLAICGAFRLNNGGDALFAIMALCFAAALIACAFLMRRRIPDGLLVWLIFIIGLTVLLMTSLRGWDIVGHDIEREFRVFTLTHMHAYWNIGFDRNPYNACLSITILPEMFARLLHVSGLIVFKVILQVIFAMCPVAIYLLLRQYISKLGAFTGSLLFICYPTFINDSAMLTRQSVAYLFFALALLMMTNKIQKKRYKALFLLCSLGVILSHYSTAYVFTAVFGLAVACKLCLAWWQRRHSFAYQVPRTVLSPLFAGLLLMITFLWYAQITATSSGLLLTLRKSITSIPSIFSGDSRSSDTSAALLFAGGKTQSNLYEAYLVSAKPGGKALPIDEKYMPQLTSDNLPLRPLGEKLNSIGIKPALITAARQDFARLLQVLALASVGYATYRMLRRKSQALGADFVCLSLAGTAMLSCLLILPVLSINYGILRAFHQSMIFLLLPMMLLLARATRHINPKVRTAVVTFGVTVLFLMFTGVFGQLLGGTSPQLSMNNSGLYYGLYYSSAADLRAFTWLKKHVPKESDVRAANFNKAFMHDPTYPFSKPGILPTQIDSETYVYLDPAQMLQQKLYANYDNSPLIMTFPRDYYDQVKNRIYSTTTTGVYQ